MTSRESDEMMKALQMTFDMLATLEQRIKQNGPAAKVAPAASAEAGAGGVAAVDEKPKGPPAPALVLGDSRATQEGSETVWAWARGTNLRVNAAEGKVVAGAALCADGATRRITWAGRLKNGEPLACSVRVGRATVSGHLTLEPAFREGDPNVLKFVINPERTYGRLLPPGPLKGRRKEDQQQREQRQEQGELVGV